MKKYLSLCLSLFLLTGVLVGCGNTASQNEPRQGIQIALSDDGITVNGQAAANDEAQAVYIANDIVYYEAGHDFTYGEGTADEAHSKEQAQAHTVVHITKPGQYVLSGTLSRGQIAVDLGPDADEDPEAVVTLVLNGVDIKCEVAPAVIFYNVYECGDKDTESATKDVDTSAAGANIVLADGSKNTVSGAFVARIYKPDSVVLNSEGTEVEDAKKLHKYDGAVYSKMSMNVNGEEKGNGSLHINALNEGLDSELHLTINGGNISIVSGNDGINTNEDGVSVTTVNGGTLKIRVNGSTGEGDGIDSNGWLVINGGSVFAQACATSGDAGIDSDMGIHINGGTVAASGNMLDRIGDSRQNFAVFQFAEAQEGGLYSLKDEKGSPVFEQEIENRFSYLILSGDGLAEGKYSLWCGETKMEGVQSANGAMGGGHMPQGGMVPPEGMTEPGELTPPEEMIRPDGMTPPDGMATPGGMTPPDGMAAPGGMTPPDAGSVPNRPAENAVPGSASDIFEILNGQNYFTNVA